MKTKVVKVNRKTVADLQKQVKANPSSKHAEHCVKELLRRR